jgi:hypothetical protein
MAGAQRKLKAEESNPESPVKKVQKGSVVEQDDDAFDESDVKGMFKALMQQMRSLTGAVEQAGSRASAAQQSALEAKQAAAAVASDLGKMKEEIHELKQVGMRKVVEEVLQSGHRTDNLPARAKQPFSNAPKVHSTESEDKRSRTIGFGQFPKDTKAENIIKFMEGVLEEAREDIEEMFAYGKKFAERGGARFKTSQAMWAYLKGKAGDHTHTYMGHHIYCSADAKARDPQSEDAKRERAVRKMVRAIIEVNGGDGTEVKKHIDTNYKKGVVWWKEGRVAEWMHGSLRLVGQGAQFQDKFDELFKLE